MVYSGEGDAGMMQEEMQELRVNLNGQALVRI